MLDPGQNGEALGNHDLIGDDRAIGIGLIVQRLRVPGCNRQGRRIGEVRPFLFVSIKGCPCKKRHHANGGHEQQA